VPLHPFSEAQALAELRERCEITGKFDTQCRRPPRRVSDRLSELHRFRYPQTARRPAVGTIHPGGRRIRLSACQDFSLRPTRTSLQPHAFAMAMFEAMRQIFPVPRRRDGHSRHYGTREAGDRQLPAWRRPVTSPRRRSTGRLTTTATTAPTTIAAADRAQAQERSARTFQLLRLQKDSRARARGRENVSTCRREIEPNTPGTF